VSITKQQEAEVRERAQLKHAAISKTFKVLTEYLWTPKGVSGVYLDQSLLTLAVTSYAYDMERLRDFHNIQVPDEAKQACYLVKWIIKTRPVQFSISQQQLTEIHLALNEVLALHVAFNLLKVRPAMISENFVELLVYTLRHRKFEEDSFLPMCTMLRRLTKMQASLPERI
jgi:hypothetical protein